ncbi:MAG: sigma-70 family RNA polymerase sigma factor [Propionibacteriaceae bacterium]|nr:sigma-70 family RNA polymerase sigma factor [Propionibacteriaceae bacterium]
MAETFASWARSAAPMLYRRALLLTSNHHSAEDLVQDTLTKMCLAWPKLDGVANVDAYATRALYHQFVSHRRRRSSQEVVTDDLPELLNPDGDPSLHLDLTRAIGDLKPAERALVVARYVEDLPVAEVAHLMGRTEGWVKVTSSRAMRKLRLSPRLAK